MSLFLSEVSQALIHEIALHITSPHPNRGEEAIGDAVAAELCRTQSALGSVDWPVYWMS